MAGENDSFDIYVDNRGEWRWRRKDEKGNVVGASSEGYARRADCEANMHRGPKDSDKWEFFEDKRSQWRWRRKASNGQVVGASTGGFKGRDDAEANAARQGYAA